MKNWFDLAKEAGVTIRGHYDESGITPAELVRLCELVAEAAATHMRGAAEAQGRAAKNLSGAMQELADMRVEVERLTSLRDAAEEREQATLRQLDRIRAISQENYDKLNGWMHACREAEAQRDALLAAIDRIGMTGLDARQMADDAIASTKGGAA